VEPRIVTAVEALCDMVFRAVTLCAVDVIWPEWPCHKAVIFAHYTAQHQPCHTL